MHLTCMHVGTQDRHRTQLMHLRRLQAIRGGLGNTRGCYVYDVQYSYVTSTVSVHQDAKTKTWIVVYRNRLLERVGRWRPKWW
jgi:hypothetical protein